MKLSISGVIQHLFPAGTGGGSDDTLRPPVWPPDLFGVCGYIADKSDCYGELLDFTENGIGGIIAQEQEDLEQFGRLLADCARWQPLPEEIQHFLTENWSKLDSCLEPLVYAQGEDKPGWILPVLRLLIVADIACEGMGFYRPHDADEVDNSSEAPDSNWIPRVYSWMSLPDMDQSVIVTNYRGEDWYHDLSNDVANAPTSPIIVPASACLYIPDDRLCVLPKALTPNVGCTIRSLTQNLSLHPGSGQVKSKWYNHEFDMDEEDIRHLNVLVIPYPYHITSTAFAPSAPVSRNFNVFSVQQDWLSKDGIHTRRTDIVCIVRELYLAAQQEKRPIDILVFPELALDDNTFEKIIETVREVAGQRFTLIVAGISRQDENARPRNSSVTAYVKDGDIERFTYQDKHHRWKLDSTQIRTYGLEKVLADPLQQSGDWWEESDVSDRRVNYHVFQRGACFATLICEDLARQDPCKNTLQATGPNLVFAAHRWPGRYTLGLTEDPGASVLTVTSLGLVERSNWAYNGTRQTIALWGNRHGVREIDLPPGHQGVLLSLERQNVPVRTIDHRCGEGAAWELISVTPLKMD